MKRQRRSLNRTISQSSRVNKLSDIGALLYTWMIPQYDDEGRMDGDPDDIRYNVLPRRDVSTGDIIDQLFLMDELGLINWYVVNNRPFIEMAPDAWKDHQTFRGIKKTPSTIPNYEPTSHKKYKDFLQLQERTPEAVDTNTGSGGHEHQNGGHEHQERSHKIREDKSFITNVIKQPEAGHFSEKVAGKYLKQIISLCQKLKNKSNGKRPFNSYQWVQQKFNSGLIHPQAVIDALAGLLEYWDGLKKSPWAYADSIFKTRNQNYNEAEQIQEHEKLKKEMQDFEKTDAGKKLTGLLGNIG